MEMHTKEISLMQIWQISLGPNIGTNILLKGELDKRDITHKKNIIGYIWIRIVRNNHWEARKVELW